MGALNLDPTTTSTRAGLGGSFVRDIIRGKSIEPKRSGLVKVAKVLGCSVEDLTGERRQKPSPLIQKETDGTIAISELDVHSRSGMGIDGEAAVMANEEAISVVGVHTMPAASFRESYGISSTRIRIIPVKGDSMEPRLWPGVNTEAGAKRDIQPDSNFNGFATTLGIP